jgi:hypothetical protein
LFTSIELRNDTFNCFPLIHPIYHGSHKEYLILQHNERV